MATTIQMGSNKHFWKLRSWFLNEPQQSYFETLQYPCVGKWLGIIWCRRVPTGSWWQVLLPADKHHLFLCFPLMCKRNCTRGNWSAFVTFYTKLFKHFAYVFMPIRRSKEEGSWKRAVFIRLSISVTHVCFNEDSWLQCSGKHLTLNKRMSRKAEKHPVFTQLHNGNLFHDRNYYSIISDHHFQGSLKRIHMCT
jgi:hypothetical protein